MKINCLILIYLSCLIAKYEVNAQQKCDYGFNGEKCDGNMSSKIKLTNDFITIICCSLKIYRMRHYLQ